MKSLIKDNLTGARARPETPKNAFYVFIRDYPPENIGIGGLALPKYLESLGSP